MGLLEVSGSLDAGPPSVTASDSFPGAAVTVPLRLPAGRKTYSVATGVLPRNLSSPLSFAVIDGVGAGNAVTQGTFLYLRASQAFELRITTDDGLGGSVVTTLPVSTLLLLEFDSVKFLKLLEAKGTTQLEYFVCGNS